MPAVCNVYLQAHFHEYTIQRGEIPLWRNLSQYDGIDLMYDEIQVLRIFFRPLIQNAFYRKEVILQDKFLFFFIIVCIFPPSLWRVL